MGRDQSITTPHRHAATPHPTQIPSPTPMINLSYAALHPGMTPGHPREPLGWVLQRTTAEFYNRGRQPTLGLVARLVAPDLHIQSACNEGRQTEATNRPERTGQATPVVGESKTATGVSAGHRFVSPAGLVARGGGRTADLRFSV